jgi:signal transduction histidine kinase
MAKTIGFHIANPHFSFIWSGFYSLSTPFSPQLPANTVLPLEPGFLATAIYALSYVIFAFILYLQAYFTAQMPAAKKQRLLACLLNIPVLIATFNTYIVRGMDYADWKINFWPVIIFITLFLILLTRFSMLGYKLVITQQQFDGSIRAAATGALILNHAVKNELAKINFGIETLKIAVQAPDLQEVLKIITESTGHLSELMNRIKGQMQDMNLLFECCSLAEIVEPALDSIQAAIGDRQIQIDRNYDPSLTLRVDKYHLREVMVNVLHNAVEAMDQVGGELKISSFQQRKFLKLIIADNGVGISQANLARVLEPFFSTKKFGRNFGLGLTYCYNVLRKHEGKLEIQSQEGMGTSVILILPLIRRAREKRSHLQKTRG